MHLDRRPAARAIIDAWIADAEGHEDAGGRPLLLSRPARTTPRRTVDVMPSALVALGRAVPAGLDGESFL